jgi:prepilin-type processing-associated H-X9-DG protein
MSINYNDTATYANATAATTIVNVFICPSDGALNPRNTINVPGTGSKPYAPASYANNIGTSRTFSGGMFDGPAYQLGASNLGPVVSLASLTDGTSSTALWSEWKRANGVQSASNPGEIYQASMQFNASSTPPSPALVGTLGQSMQAVSSTCQSSTTPYAQDKGFSYFEDDAGFGGGYSHLNTPNQKACFFKNDVPWGVTDHTLVGASSYHPGGVNVGFLDGSVKFIKDSISYQTWGSIATKAGGEIVSADSY